MKRITSIVALAAVLTTPISLAALDWTPSDVPGGTGIAFAGDGAGTIWVATEGGGVFRSTTVGATWTAVNQGLDSRAAIELERSGTGRLWVATDAGPFSSTDGGDTWSGPGSGLTDPGILALALNPSNGAPWVGTPDGVFTSADNGTTWTATAAGLPDSRIMSMAVAGGTVFVGTRDEGVWRSDDNGQSWEASGTGSEGLEIVFLEGDAVDPLAVWAGTGGTGLLVSDDGGDTWAPAGTGLDNLDVSAITFDPTDGSVIWAGTDVGTFRSQDGGQVWVATPGIPPQTGVEALLIDAADPGRTFTGVAVVGAAFSDDDGTTWVTSGAGLAGVAVSAIDVGGPVYLASEGAGVYRTTDRGRNWAWLGDGPGSLLTTSLAVDPTDGERVFAGNRLDGVWRSTDGGGSWQQVSAGLTNQRVQALAMDINDPSTLYAGTRGGVFATSDSGNTWASASSGLGDLDVMAIAVDPDDSLLLFASTDDGLSRSTDGGASWQPSGAGLGGLDVTSLLAAGGRWWAGTDSGVFVSDNQGSTWAEPGDPLVLPVLSLAWDPRPDHWVAAGTEGGGIMVLASDGSWSSDAPELATATVTAIDFAADTSGFAGTPGGSWVREELPLFADGFESGATDAWTATVP